MMLNIFLREFYRKSNYKSIIEYMYKIYNIYIGDIQWFSNPRTQNAPKKITESIT